MNHECIHNQCHSSTGHPEVTFMSRNTNERKEEIIIIIIINKKERDRRETLDRAYDNNKTKDTKTRYLDYVVGLNVV